MYTILQLQQVVEAQAQWIADEPSGMDRQAITPGKIGNNALILTGIRRCGKSTLLRQIYRNTTESSIFLNFEDPRLAGFALSDFNRLHELAVKQGVRSYFFDEIQNVEQWENFVRFRLDEQYKVFITGSNASVLSKELGTKLTGRHLSVELFPFSFSEFLSFTGKESGPESLILYLENGGFPEYLKTGIQELLVQYFNDILLRDIAVRHGIRNTTVLRQLAVWLITNVGKPFTGNSLRKIFQIGSSASVMEYISFLSDAYLFFFVPKFSYAAKIQLVNPKKIYCIDNGFVRANSISFSEDKGRLLENAVFLHFKRLGCEVFYFKEQRECDFVIFKNGSLLEVVQVCWQLNDENINRELGGLNEAMAFFGLNKGLIITFDQEDELLLQSKIVTLRPFHLLQRA